MTRAAKLLRWYRRHGRDLPWRRTRNPYCILVSEIMLQQTQVDRVKKYYRSWLKQFPTWKKLAAASNAEVIRAWAGLGYNRRALALRDMARHVATNGVPKTETEWRSIKGIGPYTAAAVSAFAQKKRTMPIDTNIRRVLGRILLAKPYSDLKDDERIAKEAESFLPHRGHFYEVPQAIFDLATMICKKNPECARCPLRRDCPMAERFLSGRVHIPKRSTPKTKERHHRDKRFPDRIYRGRILKLVRERDEMNLSDIGPLIDKTFDKNLDQEWVKQMIKRLCQDNLLQKTESRLTLPL